MFHQWPPLSAKDEAAAAKSNEKAARSSSRRARFLDAKARTIGVDVAGLDAQLMAHAARAEEEATELERYRSWERSLQKQMESIWQEQRREKSAMFQQMKQVWDRQCDRTIRPEWDLHDPANRCRFLVGNGGGSGEERERKGVLTPDRFGVYLNEEVEEKQKALQKMHFKSFQEQVERKREEEREEAEQERRNSQEAKRLLHARQRVEEEEMQQRKQRDVELARVNVGLETMRKKWKEEERDAEVQAGSAHADKEASSAFLQECRGKEVGSGGKVVRQEWKGMRPDELAEIRNMQLQQQEQNRMQRKEEKRMETEFDEHFAQVGARAKAIHRDMQRERSSEAKKLAAVHKKQHEEFLKRSEDERHERLRPGISDEWWPFERNDR